MGKLNTTAYIFEGKTSEFLDRQINMLPDDLKNVKGKERPMFWLSKEAYENLCLELKRKARTYKGYKLVINQS